MSAYVVDREHIAYLIDAAQEIARDYGSPFRWRVMTSDGMGVLHLPYGDDDRCAQVAQELWAENVKSVSYRYPNDAPGDLPGPIDAYPYEYGAHSERYWGPWSVAQVFKSIHCYEYQTCEHPEWEASSAIAFVRALADAWSSRVPGYDAAEWGAPEPKGFRVFA